jgi:hypothetical protein
MPGTPNAKAITPIEGLWFKEQFDALHKEHLLILAKLEELYPRYVIPELETQIRRVAGLASSIDKKVPDSNVPPGMPPSTSPKP